MGDPVKAIERTPKGWRLSRDVSGVFGDSRKIKPGAVFVAIGGSVSDGHQFIGEAVANGAIAVVGEKPVGTLPVPYFRVESSRSALAELAAEFWGHPSRRLRVIGVTGTNGKTSVVYWMTHMLRAAGLQTGMVSSVVNDTGARVESAELTTPQSDELQAYLAEMRDSGFRFAVLEVSSHGIVQRRIDAIAFEMAILTNITREHLDYHQTMENYVDAKAKLFARLPEHSWGAILNRDDRWYDRVRCQVCAPVLNYGMDSGTIRGEIVHASEWSSRVMIKEDGQTVLSAVLNHPGQFNVQNLLAVVAACRKIGIPWEHIAREIPRLPGIPGRMHVIDHSPGPLAVIDYAHTPHGLEQCLKTVSRFRRGRIWLVFGARGGRDRGKRPEMGRIAALGADAIILTTDSPYHEDPAAIAEELAQGIRDTEPNRLVAVELNRAAAIARAIRMASPNDVVLITGRGPEKYQIFGDRQVPFLDAEAALDALAKWGTGTGEGGRMANGDYQCGRPHV